MSLSDDVIVGLHYSRVSRLPGSSSRYGQGAHIPSEIASRGDQLLARGSRGHPAVVAVNMRAA